MLEKFKQLQRWIYYVFFFFIFGGDFVLAGKQVVYTLFGPIYYTQDFQMLSNLVEGLLNGLYGISAGLGVLMVIVSGFQYIAAQSDEKALVAAKERLQYALTGLAIVFLAVTLSTLMYSFFK